MLIELILPQPPSLFSIFTSKFFPKELMLISLATTLLEIFPLENLIHCFTGLVKQWHFKHTSQVNVNSMDFFFFRLAYCRGNF